MVQNSVIFPGEKLGNNFQFKTGAGKAERGKSNDNTRWMQAV